jgi:hypothetical protein
MFDYYSVATTFFRRAKKQVFSEAISMSFYFQLIFLQCPPYLYSFCDIEKKLA